MIDGNDNEMGLITDSYDSIAFKGQSTQYLSNVLTEVAQMALVGEIYPPAFATSWSNSRLENGLTLQQLHPEDGRLTPAEAVAIRVLAEEGAALAQNFFKSYEKTKLIQTITDDPEGSPAEIVAGMADFGYNLLKAVSLREKITKNESKPIETKTFSDHTTKQLWVKYEGPLMLDKMAIDKHTINAAISDATEAIETKIEEPGNKENLSARIRSRRKGIELGAKIFQQVKNIAVQNGMSTTLENLVTVK